MLCYSDSLLACVGGREWQPQQPHHPISWAATNHIAIRRTTTICSILDRDVGVYSIDPSTAYLSATDWCSTDHAAWRHPPRRQPPRRHPPCGQPTTNSAIGRATSSTTGRGAERQWPAGRTTDYTTPKASRASSHACQTATGAALNASSSTSLCHHPHHLPTPRCQPSSGRGSRLCRAHGAGRALCRLSLRGGGVCVPRFVHSHAHSHIQASPVLGLGLHRRSR